MNSSQTSSHEKQVRWSYRSDIVEMLPVGIEVDETCLILANQALQSIARRYSGVDATDRELTYHNHEHSLQVVKRSIQVLSALQEVFPNDISAVDYELAILGASYHDYQQMVEEPGVNELQSAQIAYRVMVRHDYSEHEAQRVYDAIIATSIERSPDGEINQIKLKSGTQDILKFVVATADINGIAMEGTTHMIDTATKLYIEHTGDSEMRDIASFGRFISGQAGFLSQRLDTVDDDVAYYFHGNKYEIAVEVMKHIFSPGRKALSVANLLKDPLYINRFVSIIRENVDKGVSLLTSVREVGQTTISELTQTGQD